jgi:hypothetical protein
MQTHLISNCCDNKSDAPLVKVRHLSPQLAIGRPNIFLTQVPFGDDNNVVVNFKCQMQRRGGKRAYEVKVGQVSSESRILQSLQGAGSALTPGNLTALRSPGRSLASTVLTPGGSNFGLPGINPLRGPGSVLASRLNLSPFGPMKPTRGFRCPEGYQFGGRFTDERYSTCGRQLFDLPGAIGRAIGRALRSAGPGSGGQRTSGGRVSGLSVSGQPLQSRAPQIPKVSKLNTTAKQGEIKNLIEQLSTVTEPYTRLVRRDGFVLEPVVSAAVLRTVPDNRDMEGAAFITTALTQDVIGNDELGLLSNTGVDKVVYVLPGGSTLSLSKARPLTVGERRKLGKTVSQAEKLSTPQEPMAGLDFIASEMGDAISLEQNFIGVNNPNELIMAKLPGEQTKRQMRRWQYEIFAKKRTAKTRSSSNAQLEAVNENERIDDLASAVRHLNAGGSIENIDATIRSEAVKRSAMYKTGKIKNGVIIHERADGQTVFEIQPKKDFEHLGAALASEVQRSMGLNAPKVRLTGSGKRRSYMLAEAQDVESTARQLRKTPADMLPPEDILGLAISDFLTDTRDRNPSNIAPIRVNGQMRAIASINPSAGLSGLSTAEIRSRRQMEINDFFNKKQRATYMAYFAELQEKQRARALELFEKLLEQADNFDFTKFSEYLARDGKLSEAERMHLRVVETIFKNRIQQLKTSSESFKQALGLSPK